MTTSKNPSDALEALQILSNLVGKDDDLGQTCIREIKQALAQAVSAKDG
jgi:hypothetical protein